MRGKALALALTLIGAAASAQEIDMEAAIAEAKQASQIQDIATIPVSKLKAVESDGQIHYVSENGRYVITGRLVDVLQRKPLDTMKDIKDSVNRLSFDQLGMDIDTLNTVTIGNGPKRVITFIDPLCPVCIKVMQDAEKLKNEYTFKFIVVPALGAESNVLASKVQCVQNPADLVPAIMQGKMASIPMQPDCKPKGYDMTLLLSDLMGVNGVPFVIAPNGEIARGRPVNLRSWLEERQS